MKKFNKAVITLVLALVLAFVPCTVAQAACTETELLTLVNNERAIAGLKPLTADKELTRAAEVRAKESSAKWSHQRPDGTDFYTVSNAVYGENLAKGESGNTAEEIVAAWMASPSHKANVLYSTSTKTGLAIYEVNGQLYIAEEFN